MGDAAETRPIPHVILINNIIQRKDDVEETVKERLDVYERQTQPLIDFYKEKNLLSTVDGTKAINEVFEGICDILGSAN